MLTPTGVNTSNSKSSSLTQSSGVSPNTGAARSDKLLGLTRGQTATALVVSSTPINPQEKAQLQLQLQQKISDILGKPSSPQNTANSERLAQLQQSLALLKSPLLQLVKLQHNNQQQLTYTNQPLKPGDNVPVQLHESGKLLLLPGNTTNAQTGKSLQVELITQALRQSLPQQQPARTLFNALNQLQQSTSAQQLLPKPLMEALKKIQQFQKTPEQLASGQQLRQTLTSSGSLLEGKLAQQLVTKTSSDAFNSENIQSDLKVLLATALKHSATALAIAGISGGKESGKESASNIAALLQQTQGINPAQLGAALLQQSSTAPQLSGKALQTQLILLLHQQLLGSMARVQVRQLQSLPQFGEQLSQPQNMQLDIPIRWGGETHILEFKVEEKDPESASPEGGKNNQRQWQITLSFDLAEYGNFHARINILGEHINAKLWAENPQIFNAAQDRLQHLQSQLQAQGLIVEKLECHAGKPQQSQNRLSYQLVDIKT